MAVAKQLSHQQVGKLVGFLESHKSEQLSITDVISLAEVMAGSLDSLLKALDKTLYKEFVAIANEISAMKQEIAELCPADMRRNAIPEAGRELDEVVAATESATETIMTCAEEIMAADPSDTGAYQDLVNDRMIQIFEACSFQDITGQRISKVVKALALIDERVSAFTHRLKMAEDATANRAETEDERRSRELLLNGPSFAGEGVNQDDVDAMLAGSFSAK